MSLNCIFKGRRFKVLGGLLCGPLILWVVLLFIIPTDWARRRLVGRLEAATGQSVRIGKVSLGISGRLQVRDVALATRETPDDPWLQAGSASLDLHVFQVIFGCCRTAEIELSAMKARVLRRADGTFEFAEFLTPPPSSRDTATSGGTSTISPIVKLSIRDSSVIVIDQGAESEFDVTQVQGSATWSAETLSIEGLNGRLNGGTFEFAAKADRTMADPLFEMELRIRGVSITDGMQGLSYLAPVVAGAGTSLDGRINLLVALGGKGLTSARLRETLKGRGSILLDPINLDGSQLLREVEVFGRLPRSERIGTVQSTFEVGQGKVSTQDLTIKFAGLPLVLAGWTDFDGKLDYRAKTELLEKRLPKGAKSLLADLDLDIKDLGGLRITGSLDQVQVSMDRGPLANSAGRGAIDKKRLEELKGRFLDKVIR